MWAAEVIRNCFRSGDFPLTAMIAAPSQGYFGTFGEDTRLKCVRWRWVHFNPSKPFDYEYAAPPAAYRKNFYFIVEQTELLGDRSTGYGQHPDINTTDTKGIIEIECAGSEGAAWKEIPMEKFTPYKIDDPTHLAEMDYTKWGESWVRMSRLPVEVAADVLAVNSDFDEGRIDPATGYAIPDCDDIPGVDQKTGSGNTQIALNASRAHLDGLFANDEKITDDMHKGWFGVNLNQLDDYFWDGGNVTIRKIDKIDDETGYKESGQVRFYAKWSGGYYGISPYDFQTLQPVNLVSAGVNLRPNEGVYGTSSSIPDHTTRQNFPIVAA